MGVHRFDAKMKYLSNASRRETIPDQLKNLTLARGQTRQSVIACFLKNTIYWGSCAHGRSDIYSSIRYDPDRRFEFAERGAFDHITGRSGTESSPDRLFPTQHGKDHDAHLRKLSKDSFCCLQA